ncbi:hypothetical protein GCM10008965_26040 [Methylorubrum aminovorans]|nr:hypothetical protein GCM10025880_45420 [Methylorubrum aminovorans]
MRREAEAPVSGWRAASRLDQPRKAMTPALEPTEGPDHRRGAPGRRQDRLSSHEPRRAPPERVGKPVQAGSDPERIPVMNGDEQGRGTPQPEAVAWVGREA